MAMKRREDEESVLARRQMLGAGIVGATLALLPEACSSSSTPEGRDAGKDAESKGGRPDATGTDSGVDAAPDTSPDTSPDGPSDAQSDGLSDAADGAPEATLVDGSGTCVQTDYTHPVNILQAGIGSPGTSTEFADDRYSDPSCQGDAILVVNPINPVNKTRYVALSGSCTHDCNSVIANDGGCGPTYMPRCQVFADTNYFDGFGCRVPPPDAGEADASQDAGAEAGVQPGQILTDVLFCTCHGSMYDAITGEVLNGPAPSPLQVLDVCVGGGFVFVRIPKNS
jgi:Rieske Fe-S protein